MTQTLTRTIEEYSFHEFLDKFQQAVLEGYRLDLESNERFPQRFGTLSTVILIKEETVEEKPSDKDNSISIINQNKEQQTEVVSTEEAVANIQEVNSVVETTIEAAVKSKGRPKKT